MVSGRFPYLALLFVALACLTSASAPSAHAHQALRPSRIDEWRDGAFSDDMVRPKGSRVAWADYEAIRRDFPALSRRTDREIDAWILRNFNFVSRAQLELNGIRQSGIPLADPSLAENSKRGWRDGEYGRAAVLEAFDGEAPIGLVDVKGSGHYEGSPKLRSQAERIAAARAMGDAAALDKLRVSDHSDGLMSLGEAIAETSRQRAIQMRMDLHNAAHGTSYQTVESYFIIALPFDILKREGEAPIRAALYGRQAHLLRRGMYPIFPGLYEDLHGSRQHDGFGAAVDFGGSFIDDPSLAEFRDQSGGPPRDPQRSRPWKYAHETAASLGSGADADYGPIERHFADMVRPLREAWERVRPRIVESRVEAVQRHYLREPESAARFEALLELLPEVEGDERRFALHLVGRSRGAQLAEICERRLADHRPEIAQAAAEYLAAPGRELPPALAARIVAVARDPAAPELRPLVTLLHARGAELAPALTGLAELLDEPGAAADRARRALGSVPTADVPPAALAALRARLHAQRPATRIAAAAVLADWDPSYVAARAELLASLRDPELAHAGPALEWLARVRRAPGLDADLIATLSSAAPRARSALLEALRRSGAHADDARRAMLPLIRDAGSPLGDAMLELILRGGLPSEASREALFEGLRHRDLPSGLASHLVRALIDGSIPPGFDGDPRVRDRVIGMLREPGPAARYAHTFLRMRYAADPLARSALREAERSADCSARLAALHPSHPRH